MWSIFSYIFESLICGSVLYLLFHFMQMLNLSYDFRRVFILVSSLAIALFPLISISSEIVPQFGILLDPVTVGGERSGIKEATSFNLITFTNAATYIYFSVCALVLTFIMLHIFKIFALKFKSEHFKNSQFTLIVSDSVEVPFSFFNTIYINGNAGAEEKDYILTHEFSHISRRHSVDVVLINFISIFQWFNPFISLFKRSLIETHEFQADKDVLKGGLEINLYRDLLLNSQFGISPYLSNSLNKSLTLKRFKKMENLEQKRAGFFAIASSLLTMALLFTVVSFTSAKEPVNNDDLKKSEIILSDTIKDEMPFMIVEVKPKFMGGDENTFTRWVAERLVYPADARAKSIQGRVILQFTINTSGKVTNVRVLRGVAQSLDQEAIRVVQTSPEWTPGMHKGEKVNVVYQFPVIFQLR